LHIFKGSKVEKDQSIKFVHSPTRFRVEPHPSVGLATGCGLESKEISGFAFHLSPFESFFDLIAQ